VILWIPRIQQGESDAKSDFFTKVKREHARRESKIKQVQNFTHKLSFPFWQI